MRRALDEGPGKIDLYKTVVILLYIKNFNGELRLDSLVLKILISESFQNRRNWRATTQQSIKKKKRLVTINL